MSEPGAGHNSGAGLLGIVERIERLNEEIKAIQDDRKQVYQEAAGAGFDAKAVRRIVRERAMDREDLDEFDALVATYWGALGRRP